MDDVLKKQVEQVYADYVKRIPEKANLFDWVHATENAHTDILAALLNFGHQRYVKSFLQAVFDEFNRDCTGVSVQTQVHSVDCLIRKDKEFCVIIENKICGACDREEQLQRYVDNINKGEEFDLSNIFVIYLTCFGGAPSEDSFPDARKSEVHYAEINYQACILPWLEQILLAVPYKEQQLIASLQLYIDCLKGILGCRDVERQAGLVRSLYLIKEIKVLQNDYQGLLALYGNHDVTESFRNAIGALITDLKRRNPYVDEYDVSYNLKWLLKNDPTPAYKNSWTHHDLGAWGSVGRFRYQADGHQYVELVRSIPGGRIRLHVPCFPDGIRSGAYVLNPDYDANTGIRSGIYDIFNRKSLESNGFKVDKPTPCFPMPDFKMDVSLTIVAKHIIDMIERLDKAYKDVKPKTI